MIAGLGEWVLRETCCQGSRWLSQGLPPLRLAVNISPQQLRQPGIERLLTNILEETGFPAQHLEIEVIRVLFDAARKESGVDPEANQQPGKVRLAVDDLHRLLFSISNKQFPVQLLKIDRSFITGILDNRTDKELSRHYRSHGTYPGFQGVG